MKATNTRVTQDFLEDRKPTDDEYPIQKWIIFCETLMVEGYTLTLYEARHTFSKYITVTREKSWKKFKVRFSNHKPLNYRELRGDCDFFVGVTNLGVTNTNMALEAVRKYFKD